MESWPTKNKDLLVAQDIIDKYIDFNDGDELEVYEYVVDNCLEIKCDQPEWVIELIETFQYKYGIDVGMEISLKILTNCMINNATIH